MEGHPLASSNIEQLGIVYVILGVEVTETEFEFTIKIVDGEWEDVVYNEDNLEVDISILVAKATKLGAFEDAVDALGLVEEDYTEGNWETIEGYIEGVETAIAALETVEEVDAYSFADVIANIQAVAKQRCAIIYMDGEELYTGGFVATYPETHIYGIQTTLVDPEPKVDGETTYAFIGWLLLVEGDDDRIVHVLGASDYTADITLYAQWVVITEQAYFEAEGLGTVNATRKAIYQKFVLYDDQGVKINLSLMDVKSITETFGNTTRALSPDSDLVLYFNAVTKPVGDYIYRVVLADGITSYEATLSWERTELSVDLVSESAVEYGDKPGLYNEYLIDETLSLADDIKVYMVDTEGTPVGYDEYFDKDNRKIYFRVSDHDFEQTDGEYFFYINNGGDWYVSKIEYFS